MSQLRMIYVLTIITLASPLALAAADFRFLTTSLPNGSTNAVYSVTVLTANADGPITFSITAGRLPTGLNLDAATGYISGRPTVVEQPSVTITANDGVTAINLSTSIKVNAAGGGGNAGEQFTNTSLAQGRVGVAYTETLTLINGVGPYVFGAADLPAGLSLNGITGVISGTPAEAGTFYVTLTGNDAGENNKVIITLPLLVLPANSDFKFTIVLLDNGQIGTAYSDTWTTSGGTGPVKFSGSGLPAGLSVNADTGVVSGMPAEAGTFFVHLNATSGQDSITSNRSLWIAPSASSNFYWDFYGLPAAIVNQTYTRQPPIVVATKNPSPGGGVTYSALGFPEGIAFNTSSGEVSGTPIEIGLYPVTITATDTAGNVLTLNIDFAVLSPKGGDLNSLPVNLWVVKQSLKKSATPHKDAWKASYIYNADRRTGKAFPAGFAPSASAFVASLGSRTLTLTTANLPAASGRFSYKSAKGTAPAVSVLIDPHKQSIQIATGSDTFTDTVPGVLSNTVVLGRKGYKLDEFFDSKGVFTATSGYRKTAFVVAAAKLTSGKGAAKDSASFSMLLGDPAFLYAPGSSTMQIRVLNAGVAFIDKTFTSLVTGTQSTDAKTGQKVFKLKSSKDAATTNALSKFSYDSKKGKLTLSLKNLTLALSGAEVHVGVELTIGDKIYFTSVTIFSPAGGSYSTTML